MSDRHVMSCHVISCDVDVCVFTYVSVDETLADEEVDKIVESGQANDVIKKALISDNLQDVVRVIEERHLVRHRSNKTQRQHEQ